MNPENKSVTSIRRALVSLLAKHDFDEIQVKHLVNEADIARATFYLHFSSKEAVLVDYIDSMFDDFFGQIEKTLVATDAIDENVAVHMFNTFKSNAEFSRVLMQDANHPIVLKRFKGYVARIVGRISINNQSISVPKEQLGFLVDYWAGGSLLLIHRWVIQDFQPSVAEMASLYSKLTISAMKNLLAHE